MYDWRLKLGVGSYVREIIMFRINSLNDYLTLNTDNKLIDSKQPGRYLVTCF